MNTPLSKKTLQTDWQSRFDELFCSAVGGSLQMKGCFDVGFGTSPEVMPQVKAFISNERKLVIEEVKKELILVRDRLDAAIAGGRGNDEICRAFNDIDDLISRLEKLESK